MVLAAGVQSKSFHFNAFRSAYSASAHATMQDDIDRPQRLWRTFEKGVDKIEGMGYSVIRLEASRHRIPDSG